MKKILLVILLLINLCSCSNGIKVKESSLLGVKTYVYEEYNMPQELGKPHLTDDEILNYSNMDNDIIFNEIDSYIDLLRIDENKDYSNKFSNDDLFIWAFKHFENVGYIHTEYIDELNKKIFGKLIYIQTENNIYVLNIAQDSSNKEYLKYFKADQAIFDDKDELYNAINAYYPVNYWLIEIIDNIITLPNGELSSISISRNTECYEYNGYKLPVGLGMPELNDKEIEELTKTTDYKKIEDSINNIGDAVAYIEAKGMKIQADNDSRGYSFKNGVTYSCSGAQIIDMNVAACTGASTLLNFLLFDDYDEFGYITGYEHTIDYAKGHDGRYYIIDGTCVIGNHMWLSNYSIDGNADTLEELMNDYINHPIFNYFEHQDFMISWIYDGIWGYGEDWDSFLFPPGSKNATIWKEIDNKTQIKYFEIDGFSLNHYDYINNKNGE